MRKIEFVFLWEDRTWDTRVFSVPDEVKEPAKAEEWFRENHFGNFRKAVNFYFWSDITEENGNETDHPHG